MLISIYKIRLDPAENLESLKKDMHTIKKVDLDLDNLKGCDKGILFYQKINNNQDWIKTINSILKTKKLEDINLEKYRAVLILQIEENIYAISFSGGIYLIKNKYIDYNFGFESIKYFIDNNNVLSYSKTEVGNDLINIDGRSRKNIPIYKISKTEELSIINSVSGFNDLIGTMFGKYNLKVNIDEDNFTEELIELLMYISDITSIKKKKLNLKNNLEKIKDKGDVKYLDYKIVKSIQELTDKHIKNGRELKDSEVSEFRVNYNFKKREDFKGYKFTGIRKNRVFDDVNICYYLEGLCNIIYNKELLDDKEYILNKIKRDKIVMESENEYIEQTVYDSLVIEYPLDDQNLNAILINGFWYYLDRDYYNRLYNNIIENIDDSLGLINQSTDTKKEADYNSNLAKEIDGQVLDKKLYEFTEIKGRERFFGHSKVEPCDVIKYDKEKDKIYMYHIKINDNGPGISHLSTQATISTDLLFDESLSEDYIEFIREQMKKYIKEEYNNKLTEKEINEIIPEREKFNRNNIVVVLGIIDHRNVMKPEKYLTILKMKAIDSAVKAITNKGVKVIIHPIKGVKTKA